MSVSDTVMLVVTMCNSDNNSRAMTNQARSIVARAASKTDSEQMPGAGNDSE